MEVVYVFKEEWSIIFNMTGATKLKKNVLNKDLLQNCITNCSNFTQSHAFNEKVNISPQTRHTSSGPTEY